ncbi:MAG: hypothetical protein WBM36_00395, partial [Lysobacterales bacterium]
LGGVAADSAFKVTDVDYSPHLSVQMKIPVKVFSYNVELLYNICIDKVKHNLKNKLKLFLVILIFVTIYCHYIY